jgi:hypothetical protein
MTMATKHSTARVRSSRNRGNAALKPPAHPEPAQAGALEIVEEAIERERARLMNAETILHCVVIAMDEAECVSSHGPYFPNIIGMARELVIESINQLDSVQIGPMLEKLALEGKYEVKESAAEYLH